MAFAPHRVRYTRAEFIALERSSNVKHEYLDGVIYAMAGGSPVHAAIAVNVSASLHASLRGKPCRVHSSDLRIRVMDTGLETYPDVTVVCGYAEVDPEEPNVITNPVVVIEITSPSTEDYDRTEKLEHYKRVPSLREIVFVGHREQLVEVLRRENDGSWSRHQARAGAVIELASIDCALRVSDIYQDPLAP